MEMIFMQQTMRWFGPSDPVSLRDIRQAGCSGVVSALHQIAPGEIWTPAEIFKRKRIIEDAGMQWSVVESLPIHDDIKRKTGGYKNYIQNFKKSLRNIATGGLKVVVYNFMPVLDWIRTDIAYEMPDKSRALRFEKNAFIAFDLFLLKRPGADNDYSEREKHAARILIESMTKNEKEILYQNALLGLPGTSDHFTDNEILAALRTYETINRNTLKENLFYFLHEIIPLAEEFGLKMAIHPDDPPYPILGLPRVVSTEKDIDVIINAVPTRNNGICFCTGSLGVLPGNKLSEMIRKFGDHIHFLHLRNTRRDASGNFFEADHLDGDTDIASVVREILLLMKRTGIRLPMRPDHGHQMLDDLQKKTYPGYSAIGRLKGLAELRGLELGVARSLEAGT